MSRNWMDRVVDYRWIIIAFVILATGAAGVMATKVRFDSSIEMWFLEDDPELADYNRFTKHFGGDEFVAIGLAADDIFSRPVLESILRLTESAKEAPHVLNVRSVTAVAFPGARHELPDDPAIQAARAQLLASPVERGWLVSPDASVTAVIVAMSRAGNTVEGKNALVTALRDLVEQEQGKAPGVEFFLAGTPVLDEAFFRYNNRDLALLFPLTIALILLAGIAAFRRPTAALLQLAVVGISVIWVYGVMGTLGLRMSVLSSALPPLLLAIGVADSVHVLSDFYRRIAGGSTRDRAAADSVGHLFKPCAFTSLTTAAGLLALLVSPMQPVREFGALAAAGVMFAFLLSIGFLPAMLAVLPAPHPKPSGRRGHGLLGGLLSLFDRWTQRRPRLFVLLGLLLAAGSLWAIPKLKVGIYALDWFPRNDPVALDLRRADHDLGGSSTLEFLVTAPDGGMADPAVLDWIFAFERWLEAEIPGLTRAMSIADLQRELPVRPDADTSTGPTRATISTQFDALRRSRPDEVARLVDQDHTLGRISARIRLDQSTEVVHAFERIEEKIADGATDRTWSVTMTGYIRLMGKMEDYLIKSQIKSFALAFGVITLMIAGLLRSWKLGLFAMIPNLLPVAMGLGTMALTGIGLSPGTVMIGAIALGLVVDDTVHFLVALRRSLEEDGELDAAIASALHASGRPIVLTSLILAGGFGVLTFGSFNPSIQFGAVSALVIAFALFADLLLLPAALRVFRPAWTTPSR